MPAVADYLALVPSANSSKPKFMAMVAAIAQAAVDQQNFLNSMPAAFDLDTAVGVQLDAVGLWIGLSRSIKVPIAGVYFSWDTTLLGWGQGVWFQDGVSQSTVSVLDDGTYRTLLRAKIGTNHWDGSNEESVAILHAIFDPVNLSQTLTDNQDMTLKITLAGQEISALLQAVITGGYVPVRPVGVLATFEFDISTATAIDSRFEAGQCPVLLSNGNLTISYQNGATSSNTYLATNPKTTGKPYWEVTAVSEHNSQPFWGVGVSSAAGFGTISNLSQTVASAGVFADGSLNPLGGSPGTWGGTISTGDVVRLRFTLSTATLEAAVNGGSWFVVQAGISGTSFRAGIYGQQGGNYPEGATFNFGNSPFVYTVPTGFDPGWLP